MPKKKTVVKKDPELTVKKLVSEFISHKREMEILEQTMNGLKERLYEFADATKDGVLYGLDGEKIKVMEVVKTTYDPTDTHRVLVEMEMEDNFFDVISVKSAELTKLIGKVNTAEIKSKSTTFKQIRELKKEK